MCELIVQPLHVWTLTSIASPIDMWYMNSIVTFELTIEWQGVFLWQQCCEEFVEVWALWRVVPKCNVLGNYGNRVVVFEGVRRVPDPNFQSQTINELVADPLPMKGVETCEALHVHITVLLPLNPPLTNQIASSQVDSVGHFNGFQCACENNWECVPEVVTWLPPTNQIAEWRNQFINQSTHTHSKMNMNHDQRQKTCS